MATKKQLAALAKGREKLAKSRKLNGLKDLFKRKKDKPTEAKKTIKKTVKKSSKATATAKKAVRKQLSETKKKVRKATTKIFNDAKKKANKTTKKALDATKKTLAKKGLAGVSDKTKLKRIREWAEQSVAYLSYSQPYSKGYKDALVFAKEQVLDILNQ